MRSGLLHALCMACFEAVGMSFEPQTFDVSGEVRGKTHP